MSPVPVLPTDRITLLGGSGATLEFTVGGGEGGDDEEVMLTIEVPEEEAKLVQYAWAFEVRY